MNENQQVLNDLHWVSIYGDMIYQMMIFFWISVVIVGGIIVYKQIKKRKTKVNNE
jgi:hypothetical protein